MPCTVWKNCDIVPNGGVMNQCIRTGPRTGQHATWQTGTEDLGPAANHKRNVV